MSLPSSQLDAFVGVAKALSFSGAARQLNITQSALSQRILKLESELGSTLFIREPRGIRLTELGQRLLRYCQMKDSLEAEFLSDLRSADSHSLSGIIRIGGFSTVVRSVLLPSIAHLMNGNSNLQLEIFTREVQQLPTLLEIGAADFIFLNRICEKKGVESVSIGHELNVLVEPRTGRFQENVFLDHDADDMTTVDFFKIQKNPPEIFKRAFFDEIYTIIDAVLAGAGRAVLPIHLLRENKNLKASKRYTPLRTPVYLCYYKQPFYTALQKQVIESITLKAPLMLLEPRAKQSPPEPPKQRAPKPPKAPKMRNKPKAHRLPEV
jgi:DNA-binding transcriptional LysR family regulator